MNAPHSIPYGGLEGDGDHILFTIDTHPSSNLLATGEINGQVTLYRYSSGVDCEAILSLNHHPHHSCRALQFSHSGTRFYSGSNQKGKIYITDTESGTLLCQLKKAHSAALYSLHGLSERLLASGDERGEVKLWDSRSWNCVMTVRENRDFISDMACDQEHTTLLATSGDGTLSAIDLRQRRLEQRSDPAESELLSLAVVKGGRKVVCGDSEGCLLLFTWGLWGDITDRYPGHPQSIDSLIQTSESVVCTGCMDGAIRAVQILPNEVLQVIGRHTENYPIDCMRLTHDGHYLVTSSQDCCEFWAVQDIPKFALNRAGVVWSGEAEGDGGHGEGRGRGEKGAEEDRRWKRRKRRKRKQKQGDEDDHHQAASDFFSDL